MRAFGPIRRSTSSVKLPFALQEVEPAKISFLYSSTSILAGQVPVTVTGEVVKRCPLGGPTI